MLFGDGELFRLFFRWRSSAKLTRRQRIRLLTRLNRLTETNPIEAFSERGSPTHAELVDILHQLASPPVRPLVGGEPVRAPVVEDQQIGLDQGAEQAGEATVTVGKFEIGEQPRHAAVEHRVEIFPRWISC